MQGTEGTLKNVHWWKSNDWTIYRGEFRVMETKAWWSLRNWCSQYYLVSVETRAGSGVTGTFERWSHGSRVRTEFRAVETGHMQEEHHLLTPCWCFLNPESNWKSEARVCSPQRSDWEAQRWLQNGCGGQDMWERVQRGKFI